jgi:hypothetical protein
MPDTFQLGARGIDLSGRLAFSNVVVASPAGNAETIIAQATLPGGLNLATGVLLNGWAAYTIGATGASCRLRLRQSTVLGTIVGDTGAMTGGHNTAGQLVADDVNGLDTAPATPALYVLTLQVGGATGASAVSGALISLTAV